MRNPFRLFYHADEWTALTDRVRVARLRSALVEIDLAVRCLPVGRERQRLQACANALSKALLPDAPE